MAASSSRRDFLSGRAAASELTSAQDRLADRVVDASGRPVPGVGETVRIETRAMACVWQIMLPPGPPEQIMTASEILDDVHELERLMTIWSDDGVLKAFNDNPSLKPVAVPPRLFAAIERAVALSDTLEDCFDPTSGPLVSLWRTARGEDRIPTEDEVAEARSRCGRRHLTLDANLCTVQRAVPGMALNLGAFGKGFALDELAGQLRDAGFESFLVHGGHSTVLAAGRSGTHNGWPVALRNPLRTERQFGTVLLQNEALSSSGSNVQFFRHEGKRYGHLLDLRTGWPADGVLSATVLTGSAADADAFSTAFYVGGLDFGRRLCDTFAAPNRNGASSQSESRSVDAILTPQPTGAAIEPVVLGELSSRFFPQDAAAATRPVDDRR